MFNVQISTPSVHWDALSTVHPWLTPWPHCPSLFPQTDILTRTIGSSSSRMCSFGASIMWHPGLVWLVHVTLSTVSEWGPLHDHICSCTFFLPRMDMSSWPGGSRMIKNLCFGGYGYRCCLQVNCMDVGPLPGQICLSLRYRDKMSNWLELLKNVQEVFLCLY